MNCVSAVNCGCPCVQKKKGTSVIKGTAVAGVIGAGTMGTGAYIGAKYALKNPMLKEAYSNKATVNMLKDAINSSKMPNMAKNFYNNYIASFVQMVKTGKVNMKFVGKQAAIGAAIMGTGYLVYRGIKAMFGSNKA